MCVTKMPFIAWACSSGASKIFLPNMTYESSVFSVKSILLTGTFNGLTLISQMGMMNAASVLPDVHKLFLLAIILEMAGY